MKPNAVKLKIVLRRTEPNVWRTVLIPPVMTLEDLHMVVQLAMGWESNHLFKFTIRGVHYSMPDEHFPSVNQDKHLDIPVNRVLQGVQTFSYIYDFGDYWEHQIRVLEPQTTSKQLPVCLEGANACPPEDCGGVPGFENLKAVLADKNHKDHKEFLDWIGEDYNPGSFCLDQVNDSLSKHDFMINL